MTRRPASLLAIALACVASFAPVSARAGPPYLTDDPQPTDRGHWEIYDFVAGARGPEGLDGEAGLDLNYGAAKDLQLTAVLPLGFADAHDFDLRRLRVGAADVELAAKYRFLHQADGKGVDVSLFPRLFAPTGGARYGTDHARLLLPVWAQKDVGPWSLFGGAGYEINPGAGRRNAWQGGVAFSRALGERWSLGAEAFAQGDDADDGGGYAALNLALTYRLVEHWSLLASAGPTFAAAGRDGQVFYLALKADY